MNKLLAAFTALSLLLSAGRVDSRMYDTTPEPAAVISAEATAEDVARMLTSARDALEQEGIAVTDAAFAEVLSFYDHVLAFAAQAGENSYVYLSMLEPAEMRFELLFNTGVGVFDWDTGDWTPTSDQIYCFDAEFAFEDRMYATFLQGVESIVPGVQIESVTEPRTQAAPAASARELLERLLDPSLGDTHSVSFTMNGHDYHFDLTDQGDWIDSAIFTHINEALAAESCEYRVHVLTSDFNQMVILYYGPAGTARRLRALIEGN